jgi:hypothetical protein
MTTDHAAALAKALEQVLPYTEAERLAEQAAVRLRQVDRVPISYAVRKAQATLDAYHASKEQTDG